jgi:hypothetical protein
MTSRATGVVLRMLQVPPRPLVHKEYKIDIMFEE